MRGAGPGRSARSSLVNLFLRAGRVTAAGRGVMLAVSMAEWSIRAKTKGEPRAVAAASSDVTSRRRDGDARDVASECHREAGGKGRPSAGRTWSGSRLRAHALPRAFQREADAHRAIILAILVEPVPIRGQSERQTLFDYLMFEFFKGYFSSDLVNPPLGRRDADQRPWEGIGAGTEPLVVAIPPGRWPNGKKVIEEAGPRREHAGPARAGKITRIWPMKEWRYC